jgi:hypothetical protein
MSLQAASISRFANFAHLMVSCRVQVAIPGAAVLARQSYSDTPSALEAAVVAGQRFRRSSLDAGNPAAVAAALEQVRQANAGTL